MLILRSSLLSLWEMLCDFLIAFYLLFIYFVACRGLNMSHGICVEVRGHYSRAGSLLIPYDQRGTWIIRFGGKYLCPLSHLTSPIFCFRRQCLFLTLNSPCNVGQAVQRTPGFSYLYFPSTGIRSTCYSTQLFTWVVGTELRCSCLYNKIFTSEPAPQPSLDDSDGKQDRSLLCMTFHKLARRGYRIHTGAAIIPTLAAGSEHAPPELPAGRSEGLRDLGCLEEVENS